MFKFFRKRDVVVQPIPSRQSYKEHKNAFYAKVEAEHRAQQVGKSEQIIPDQAELVLHEPITEARIASELGIPPTRFYVKPTGIQRVRIFDGKERPQDLQDFEAMLLKGAKREELIAKLKELALCQGFTDEEEVNDSIQVILESYETE